MRMSSLSRAKENLLQASVFLVSMLLCYALIGCGSKGSGPQMTAEDYAAEGWNRFVSGDYVGALASFGASIEKDGEFLDAYLGAGWSSLFSHQPQSALTYFANGRAKATQDTVKTDFQAGLAIAQFNLEKYQACIAEVDSCLSVSPEYSFAHRPSIDADDLKVAKANSYFQMGGDSNLALAAAVVHEVDPTIDLDPANSSSWRVNGKSYGSFSEALIRALEYLSSLTR